jgi:dGTPase
MMQAISCTHDLGHPPFGHGGEVALNYCMRNDGGFEGNGQTLRILSKLEKFSETHGADLSREALLGVLKYPVSYGNLANKKNVPRMVDETSGTPILDRKASKPPKCYMDSEEDVVDWIVGCLSDNDRTLFQSYENVVEGHHKAKYKSFSCSIMDIADDISFGVHDMEDALSLSLVNEGDFRNHVKEGDCDGLIDYLKSKYPTEFKSSAYDALVGKIFSGGSGRKHQINRILNYIITNIMVSDVEGFDELRLRYRASLSDPVSKFVGSVKNFIQEVVVFSPGVQHLEFKGQMMVISVFEVMKSDPKSFLPRDIFQKYKQTEDPMRTICDYVAGMTDSYLLKTYERLFSPRIGSVFDKL